MKMSTTRGRMISKRLVCTNYQKRACTWYICARYIRQFVPVQTDYNNGTETRVGHVEMGQLNVGALVA